MSNRRDFIELIALTGAVTTLRGETVEQPALGGGLRRLDQSAPFDKATWYEAAEAGGTLTWRFTPGSLLEVRMIGADFLLDGLTSQVFTLELKEGETGPKFRLTFAGLTECSFRARVDLSLVDLNRWQADREGAFLKPMTGGDRVDLAKIDRLILTLLRKAPGPARFALLPLPGSKDEIPKLATVLLPKGPLIDELGQSRHRDWAGKTSTVEEMSTRLRRQYAEGGKWPDHVNEWGGWKARKLGEGSGFFRVVKSDDRWWLADPSGHAFWSAGIDCVRVDCDARFDGIENALAWMPPVDQFADAYRGNDGRRRGAKSVSFLATNFIRTFGSDGWRDKWATTAYGQLRQLRFNTVGNWSEWRYASKERFPYVRPLESGSPIVPRVYRDFPDVFDPSFEKEAAQAAESLRASAEDPALIGYFLMNEPTWGFSSELPAVGMLHVTESAATREQLVRFLKERYSDAGALRRAWRLPVTFERLARGKWSGALTTEARKDLRDFSVRMVERYFKVLTSACRKVDPNHLNLGMRWAGVPPDWAVEGMKTFDVFSLNCYMEKLPRQRSDSIHALLKMPVMVGEWHFGALDVGLPASGIGHVRSQHDRGKAYRVYLDDAAANPNCVGAHWFTLYDQSALGRFDGENYNIGFLDICHRPYRELAVAARLSHERVYEVATGRLEPFRDAPEYLPKLFL